MQAYAVVEYTPTALYAVFMQHHSTRMRQFCIPSYEKARLYLRVIPIYCRASMSGVQAVKGINIQLSEGQVRKWEFEEAVSLVCTGKEKD